MVLYNCTFILQCNAQRILTTLLFFATVVALAAANIDKGSTASFSKVPLERGSTVSGFTDFIFLPDFESKDV